MKRKHLRNLMGNSKYYAVALACAGCLAGPSLRAATVWLDDLDLSATTQDWGTAHKNQSVDSHPLTVGGQTFDHGLGTHAGSVLRVKLNKGAGKFSAAVGVDDEVNKNPQSSVEFKLVGDGKVLWTSGVMHAGDAAKDVEVSLAGVQTLILEVGDAGDGISYDHADWGNAKFETGDDAQLATEVAPPEEAVILTPKPGPKPHITGAAVFGVRPGTPFLYTISATGDRPIKFSVSHLPAGLQVDPATGQITGSLATAGEYEVTLHAKNDAGRNSRKFKIISGSTIGLTPALGWNSWNCFASAVSADKVKAAADAMVASGLINHGWTYINIDDFWETHRDSTDPTLQGVHRDGNGFILPNSRFPDMKGLADYVHAKGLKIGLYSSPGPWTCGGCTASWQHEDQDAQSYAQWGFDYLKYDWCSYDEIVHGDHSLPALKKPYQVMRAALDKQPRDILFSFCQYGMGDVWKWGGETGGNSWRTTGDITDNWGSLSANGFSQDGHEKYVTPGHFNDPDMLIVGKVGWGPELHQTHLTPNEQYTHISLWCLQSSPLLIGCDMTQLDDFTLGLLSNDDVLAVDQDPLCKPAGRITKEGEIEVWGRDMADGSKVVGIFNRGEAPAKGEVKWSDLGLSGKHHVRDLWRQAELGKFKDSFSADIPRHGVILIKIR